MKTIFSRFAALAVALTTGTFLFASLLYAGNKTKGPLQDVLTAVNAKVAQSENKLIDFRESRSQAMTWLNQLRNNKTALNKIDTILLGAYDDATHESYENVIALEDSLKTKLSIISIYTAWGSKKDQVFPLLRAQAIYDLGSIPMITWEPWLNDFNPSDYVHNATAVNKNKGGMKAIAEGRYDAYIDQWALSAKKFGLPFFLRWGHEMNDPYRYPWGQQNNKPEEYVAAWQHVVNRFKAQGASNAIWIWSPHPAYSFSEFYPGKAYVDWIGLTALNYGTAATWSQWWSFKDIIGKAYSQLEKHDKPIMITEFGALAVGGDRSRWYQEALSTLPKSFPRVKSLVFFHAANDFTVTYKALDWSFEDDKNVLASVRLAFSNWQQ